MSSHDSFPESKTEINHRNESNGPGEEMEILPSYCIRRCNIQMDSNKDIPISSDNKSILQRNSPADLFFFN